MATNDELRAKLDELGVEYKASDDKAALEALLAENQPEEEAEESEEDNQSDDEAAEEEESDDEDSEESEEESDDDEVDSEIETEDASGEVTKFGVYKGDACLATFTQENHGDDFVKLAEAKAKAVGGEAKPFVDPAAPEVDKNVVDVVNKNGNLVRQYSLVTHGKEYRKLAEAFVKKHGEKKGLHIQK